MKDKDLKLRNLTDDKALGGVKWNVKDDTLGFIAKMNNKPATRRGLLAGLTNIYDPLGLDAPFLLKGKRIIPTLCNQNLEWDDPIDDEIAQEWLKWINNLITLLDKSLSQYMKPSIMNCTLHHFSDASQSGYGQCSYIRFVNDRAQIHCCFLIGKSSVTPLKFVSIP